MRAFSYLDLIGALLIARFAWKEGKESFDKTKGLKDSCGCCRV
jgi:hypothetical protein